MLALLIFCLLPVAEASISLNFYNFMKEKRGKAFAESVARYDFGLFGSFGGGNHKGGQKTKRRPSIFVHGWNLNSAAYQPLSAFWLMRGYTSEELYGSTYGSAYLPGGFGGVESYQWSLKCQYARTGKSFNLALLAITNLISRKIPVIFVHGLGGSSTAYEALKALWVVRGHYPEELYGSSYGDPMLPYASITSVDWGLRCNYVKVIRNLIIGVSEYTNSTVNVISYSMGGPISRKAILGGKCVDTGEDLGPPLTNIVDTYLGVAGAMKGAMLCLVDFSVCNHVDGMSCNSAFMKDINSVKRYEAHRKIYAMQSVSDEIVGYWACNGHPSEIPGADKTITLIGYLHLGVIGLTGPLQFNLVSKGEVVVPKGEKIVIT